MGNEEVKPLKPVQLFQISKRAILPTRAHDTDVGFDISIVDKKGEGFLFHTDLVVVFNDPTLYGELYARSSLSKHGLQLANGVGIIDPSYRGELFVALCALPNCDPLLTFPMRAAQLVIKQRNFLGTLEFEQGLWEEHKKRYIEESKRGEGGFGSTDAK